MKHFWLLPFTLVGQCYEHHCLWTMMLCYIVSLVVSERQQFVEPFSAVGYSKIFFDSLN